MSVTSENRFFQLLVFLGFIIALFFGSDFAALFGLEYQTSAQAISVLKNGILSVFEDKVSPLDGIFRAGGFSTVGITEWGLRFPSLILMVFTLFYFYQRGKNIFSGKTSLLTILLVATSFPFILIGKMGTPDIVLFSLQLITFLQLIIQLKKPNIVNQLLIGTLIVLMVFVSPFSALVFIAVNLLGLGIMHKEKKNVLPVLIFSSILPLIFTFLFFQIPFFPEGFIFSPKGGVGYFFLLLFLLLTLGIGFWVAGLVQSFSRLRKGEEFSLLILTGIFSGLLGFSWFGGFMLLLLTAKQIESYSLPNYPYKPLVKAFTIIQVVLAFFPAMILMMFGYQWFGGVGFNKGLLTGLPLWICGIVVLVGLYGEKENLIRNGIIFGGLIFSLLFWTQWFPVWETERNIKQETISLMTERVKKKKEKNLGIEPDILSQQEFDFYFNKLGRDSVDLQLFLNGIPSYHISKSSNSYPSGNLDSLKGRTYPWEEMETYYFTE